MDDAGAQAPQLLWINWTAHVVSFHQEEGFETVTFPDHDTMLAYVFLSNGTANAGYAAVPMLFAIVCIGGYRAYKNKE